LGNRKTIPALENHSKWLKSLSENLRVFKSEPKDGEVRFWASFERWISRWQARASVTGEERSKKILIPKIFFLKNFWDQKFQELFLRTLENRKTIPALENHSKLLKSLSENLRVFKSF
jgi:hypothetical protein